jgi:hypothetical protein
MAIRDALTEVSSAQTLGTGAQLSTKSVPLGVAVRARGLEAEVNVSGVTGTSPTLTIEVIGADDGALTSNVIVLDSFAPVIATGMAAKNFYMKVADLRKKAFIGLRYTMAGTSPVAVVTGGFFDERSGAQADYSQLG